MQYPHTWRVFTVTSHWCMGVLEALGLDMQPLRVYGVLSAGPGLQLQGMLGLGMVSPLSSGSMHKEGHTVSR